MLDEVLEQPELETGKTHERFTKRLKKGQRDVFVGSFIASLYRAATISTNELVTMIEEENSI